MIYGSVDTATLKLTAYGHHVIELAPRYTDDEEECKQHFVNTHYRQPDGRCIVRLPLKYSPSKLGDSLRAAQRSSLQEAVLRLLKRI